MAVTEDDDQDFLAALLMASDDESPLRTFAEAAPAVVRMLSRFDPVRTAAAFGALLLQPGLQGSALRIESLVHLALSEGGTERRPTADLLTKAFAGIGTGALTTSEEEPKDLFVGYVRSRHGGFRVLEGNWLGSGFQLQRIVQIVDDMPDGFPFDRLKASVLALLKLSDLACGRADLRRYGPGEIGPAPRLSARFASAAMGGRRHLKFSQEDLKAAGIRPDDLAGFIQRPEDRQSLLDEPWGGTPLELRPLVAAGTDVILLLPTAVSIAIRCRVIDALQRLGLTDDFVQAMGAAYDQWFSGLRHFGVGMAGRSLQFQRVKGGGIAAMSRQFDRGRHIHLVFVLDDLARIEKTGLAAFHPGAGAMAGGIETMITLAQDQAVASEDFRAGLTLVVGCGVGRPTALSFSPTPRKDWTVETVSPADLETLSDLPRFSLFELWRVLAARDRLSEAGAKLYAPQGLLQLIGQARVLEGHLLDHGHLPNGAVPEGEARILLVDPYVTLRMREEAAETWDRHVAVDVDGRPVQVMRSSVPMFEEDRGTIGYIEGELPLRGLSITSKRAWWWRLDNDSEDAGALQQRWQTLEIWIRLAAPVLDAIFPTLGEGPIEWVVTFESELRQTSRPRDPIDLEAARACLSSGADMEQRRLMTRATARFEQAFSAVENIAEQALVEALVQAAAGAAGETLTTEQLAALVGRIVPGPMARQTHAFASPSFRDYVRGSLPTATVIELDEDGLARIGLGWKARGRGEDPQIEGKAECRAFLNALVTRLEEDLIADLRKFDRQALVSLVFANHEAAAVEVADTKRTTAANLAFHKDKRRVLDTLGERESKLTAVALSSRILLEAAVCECPVAGGRRPGLLDLGRLMIQASQIFQYGGDSDAVHWDAMPPKLRITPLGDVHADRSFASKIVEPWGRRNADVRFEDAADSYADNVAPPQPLGDNSAAWEPEFLAALEETLGAPYADFRLMLDFMEDIAIRERRAAVVLRRTALLSVTTAGGTLSPDAAERVVEALTFWDRPGWRSVPEGFIPGDRQPWRFRRRLSVLRRPILKLTDEPDPLMAVAPGLAREGWVHLIFNLHNGNLPDAQLSRRMRTWKAKVADRRGQAFEKAVATRLRECGWHAEVGIEMTHLFDKGFERNYGDVDVVAWRPDGRVLLIECKDVQYRKTYGEIAEQLADFRGVIKPNGKPDLLRKHLDRVALARTDLAGVAKFAKLTAVEEVESFLVFRNPVPMQYALAKMSEQVAVRTFGELDML